METEEKSLLGRKNNDDSLRQKTTNLNNALLLNPMNSEIVFPNLEENSCEEIEYPQFFNFTSVIEEESFYNEQSLRGLIGLRNLGNTCYMNAALQALSNCPPLREYFRHYLRENLEFGSYSKIQDQQFSSSASIFYHQMLQNSHAGGSGDSNFKNRQMTIAFSDLLSRIWSDSQTFNIAPTLFLMKIRERYPQFRGFNQQDSQEFIRCFLDGIHQELRRPIRKWEADLIESESTSGSSSGDSPFSSSSKEDEQSDANSSCHSSRNDLDDIDNFETADSGLSSDAEQQCKSSINKKDNSESTTFHKISPCTSNNAPDSNTNSMKIVDHKSIITDVFDGELVSSVKCQTCQHISYTTENFQDISLSIPTVDQLEMMREAAVEFEKASTSQSDSDSFPETELSFRNIPQSNNSNDSGYWFYSMASRWLLQPWYGWLSYFYRYMFTGSISLENCLKVFFSADLLHGEDMYSCEKCTKLRNGVKQCELTRLPEILCIHLKRFRHDNLYNSKVNTKVTFPLCDLNMSEFMNESNLKKHRTELITDYDLVAIVSHRGNNVDYGHYIAYCRNDLDKNWYEFDDTLVTRVNAMEVMSKEAYVLFYQKKTSNHMERLKMQCKSMLQNPESRERLFSNTSTGSCSNSSAKLITKNSLNREKHFISRYWLQKFFTFSEPGAINNCDFLCPHGFLAPSNYADAKKPPTYYPISSSVWTFLQLNIGGGPECCSLKECLKCKICPNPEKECTNPKSYY